MALVGQSYPEYEFCPDEPASIIGEFDTGRTVTIELWVDGQVVTPTSASCSEVGNTGRYSWSTGNIPVLTASRIQYHYRMSDGVGGTDEGDFILFSKENYDGGMPSLRDQSSYIRQI